MATKLKLSDALSNTGKPRKVWQLREWEVEDTSLSDSGRRSEESIFLSLCGVFGLLIFCTIYQEKHSRFSL